MSEHHRGRPPQRSRQTPSQRSASSDPQRRAAFDVLSQVELSDAYANLLLPSTLRSRRISGRDAAFTTELVYGTLRFRGLYDAILSQCSDRPVEQIDAALLTALRMGVHQLVSMRVPDHAAVSETVALVREVVGTGPSQFVNAVLRRVGERDLAEWKTICTQGLSPIASMSIEYSHPEWIIRALSEALVSTGRDASEITALLEVNNTPAPVTLVARPGLVNVDEFRQAHNLDAGKYSPYALMGLSGDPADIPEVRTGAVGIQDEGSQLVALALATAQLSESTESTWMDMCAGPGGKAALLAALSPGTLIAIEPRKHRAELVSNVLAPQADRVQVITGDAREEADSYAGAMDRVLVDVPCTGLGALRRRPEARWRRTPADVGRLGPLQRELLTAAITAVKPGGLVCYSTCSAHIAETRLVVDDVLRKQPSMQREDVRPVLEQATNGRLNDLGNGPDVVLWPHLHGTDGMYIALLRKQVA